MLRTTTNLKLRNGTGKQGSIRVDFQTLKEIFGEPVTGFSGDGKVRAEWIIHTPAGVATIHDYKDDAPLEDVKEWSVGGRKKIVVGYILDEIEKEAGICGGCGYHITRCRHEEGVCV